MKKLLAIASATALVAGVASAAIVGYSTSFSDSDSPAFANGALNGQNSWVAHPVYSVADAAGAGILNRVNANGPIHTGTAVDITSELAAGKTITLTLTANFVGSFANQNNGAWMLGLTDNATGFPEGTTAIGAATFQNNSNTDFWLSANTLSNPTKYDTGIAWDTAYHTLTTTITKSGTPNVFDVTADLDGQTTSFAVTHSGLYGGATAYAGFRYRGNQDGNVDSFSVSSIPEPATLGLIGLFGGSMLFIRRRFMM